MEKKLIEMIVNALTTVASLQDMIRLSVALFSDKAVLTAVARLGRCQARNMEQQRVTKSAILGALASGRFSVCEKPVGCHHCELCVGAYNEKCGLHDPGPSEYFDSSEELPPMGIIVDCADGDVKLTEEGWLKLTGSTWSPWVRPLRWRYI